MPAMPRLGAHVSQRFREAVTVPDAPRWLGHPSGPQRGSAACGGGGKARRPSSQEASHGGFRKLVAIA